MNTIMLSIRKEKNLTQQEVAEKSFISRSMYCQIENGTRRPSPQVAMSIAKVLGIPWTIFYEGDDR